MICRHCDAEVRQTFVDLRTAPPSNAYLEASDLHKPELYYPLRVLVCTTCWLVQTEDYADPGELFTPTYAYLSSVSSSWLAHAKAYVDAIVSKFEIGPSSCVVEVAANDGYLLQYVRDRGIPCYGIEPTRQPADVARSKGIEIVEEFFGVALAQRLSDGRGKADIIAANNVLAHVPRLNDFVKGFTVLLKADGVATFEFPYLVQLIAKQEFDTIYHEHFSYFSVSAVNRILSANGLEIFDIEELKTHGGSLRVFAQRAESGSRPLSLAVHRLLELEGRAGIETVGYYQGFQQKVNKIKDEFVSYLLKAKADGLKIAAYGAAAKGNTLLNFAGVHADLIPYVVDRAASKQNKYLPGSRVPIVDENYMKWDRPDRVIVFPWNLKEEIEAQLAYIRNWNGKFVYAIPSLIES